MENGTNISIDIYRKVIESEIQNLRVENLNLKVVIAQLQQDKKELEDTIMTASTIRNQSDNIVSLNSKMSGRSSGEIL
jgi:hypothetical protein